jgi:hypothetical protein
VGECERKRERERERVKERKKERKKERERGNIMIKKNYSMNSE